MDVNSVSLEASLRQVKGVGPKLAELFAKKGIQTIEDALYFVPRDYEDRRKISTIRELVPNSRSVFKARITNVAFTRRGRMSRLQVHVSDGTGSAVLVWFHGSNYLEKEFVKGEWFLFYGEIRQFGGMPNVVHPDFEKLTVDEVESPPKNSASFNRIIPLYSETEGLTQKVIRKIIAQVLKMSLPHLDDPFPEDLRSRLGVPTLRESFISVHFPSQLSQEKEYSPSLKRIIFEEFFVLQLGLGLKKQRHRTENAIALKDKSGILEKFVKSLPFTLTGDQTRVMGEIKEDLSRSFPMARLVQGDVGSGKTVVAFGAAVVAKDSGYQTAFMVPTEILAQQHFRSAVKWLEPLGVTTSLLSQGSESKSTKADLLIGTHALFQKGIQFDKLGLVIVDEQHRFGVEQRGRLVKKGNAISPHVLMMTATPIPRTLALTLYGDLDLSLVREKPAGRKRIPTRVIRDRDRPQLYGRIRQAVARGEQAYIIYPLVEASEKLELKSATEMHARLSREVFSDLKVALLHGRLKPEEKERVLNEFKSGVSKILVSTTVIEVGIDVPTATMMIIEHPERLGLSQLHQLRGRVGRGERGGECFLIAEGNIGERLRVMEKTDDGFEIAEEDLKIRGPGEFLGTRQHGLPGFRVGHVLKDASLLALASKEAKAILDRDPELRAPENSRLRTMVESRWKNKIERLKGG